MFWIVKGVVTIAFGMIMFEWDVLLHGCGGLRCGIAALHGDLTWMSMDRYGLGGLFFEWRVWVV